MDALTAANERHRDLEVVALETRLHVSEQVIAYLNSEIRKTWWRRIADGSRLVLWRARAKATAKKNAELRECLALYQDAGLDTFSALLRAQQHLGDYEWEKRNGRLYCQECGAGSAHAWSPILPEHDMTCGIGKTMREIRWALQLADEVGGFSQGRKR